MASTHPKISLSVCKCKGKEGSGVRKRIDTTVNSTYQSSIHVECTVIGLKILQEYPSLSMV